MTVAELVVCTEGVWRLIERIVGAVVSMTMALLKPNEPAAPGEGKVSVAGVPPVEALIVLLASAKELVVE